jgi:two-component system cell cycle sensor histidine kinase/response regulator CckA
MIGANPAKSEVILIVDDEPLVLSFLTGTLTRYGYRVVQAESGSQALRLCRERGHSIDLIVTDVVMPGLNGSELVNAIRGLGLNPRTLFISGYTWDEAAQQGVTEWAHFIQKPFTPAQLAEKVEKVLREPKKASGGNKS